MLFDKSIIFELILCRYTGESINTEKLEALRLITKASEEQSKCCDFYDFR